MDSLNAAHTPAIHVDLGNFASTEALVDKDLTRFIWERMVEIGVDVTTPGPRELQHWDLYKELMASGTIPVVSSNLTLVENGQSKPVGQPYLIIERNGIKTALFGLMGGSQFTGAHLPEGVEVQFGDPFEAARVLVPELSTKADVVVLLSEMSTADTDRLVAEVPGIDVALYGNLAPWNEECTKVSNTIAQRTGTRGQYLGHLILILDPEGNIIDFGSKNVQMNERVPEQLALAEKVAVEEETVKKIREAQRPGADPHEGHGHEGEE